MPVRYYWVDDKDGIHRFPASRFARVFAGEERAPELSGRQIRFIEAAIDTENRKPASILRLIYPLISFDERGMIDEETQERELRSSIGLIGSQLESRAEGNLLRSGGRFEERQFESTFRWKASPELEERIVKQIFSS
jgi:hypothetical protein